MTTQVWRLLSSPLTKPLLRFPPHRTPWLQKTSLRSCCQTRMHPSSPVSWHEPSLPPGPPKEAPDGDSSAVAAYVVWQRSSSQRSGLQGGAALHGPKEEQQGGLWAPWLQVARAVRRVALRETRQLVRGQSVHRSRRT